MELKVVVFLFYICLQTRWASGSNTQGNQIASARSTGPQRKRVSANILFPNHPVSGKG